MHNPALPEHLNGDVDSFMEVNFKNKSLSLAFFTFVHTVLVDLKLDLSRFINLSSSSCKDHTMLSPYIIAELLIQVESLVSF